MTATELYKFRAEQIMDSIDYYSVQNDGTEKYIYNQMPDLLEYMDTFVSECMDTDAFDEEIELDENRNETLKSCISDITKKYFEVLESRKEFEKKSANYCE